MGRVYVRVYKANVVRVGAVEITALKLERTVDVGDSDVFDVLTEYSERYSNTPDAVVEVVEVNERTREEKRVAVYTPSRGQLLFQRPALLRRIILLDERTASHSTPTPLEALEKLAPGGEVYVYSGTVKLFKPVWGVLLETDKGVRFLRPTTVGVTKDSNSDAEGG